MAIERKRYLEICRQNSIHDKSEYVWYNSIKYYPYQYILWFDKKGNTRHSALMRSEVQKSTLQCDLADIDEYIDTAFKKWYNIN